MMINNIHRTLRNSRHLNNELEAIMNTMYNSVKTMCPKEFYKLKEKKEGDNNGKD